MQYKYKYQLLYEFNFLNSSKRTKQIAEPNPLIRLEKAPFINPLIPSLSYIFYVHSILFLYRISPLALCIIILLFTVSRGYEIVSEPITTN